jgi:two-component system response regulator AlgR
MAQALSPYLILLDIAMPDGDGISVARRIAEEWDKAKGPPPAIIFVTAFDGFAVEAFDLSAVDYLLKPVASERLARAVDRVRERRAIYAAPAPSITDYVKEFWVPHRSEMVRVAASDIERIDAERDYVRLHSVGRNYLLHHTMAGLDTRLDPEMFIRLHRSVIVRRDRIHSLGHDRAGAWHAELVDGDTVRIGRTYLQSAKDMLRR